MRRREQGWAVTSSIGVVLLWIGAAAAVPALAAGIDWEKQGAFQVCLDAKAKVWIDGKVELVVNDDPDMSAINDAAVAQWATQALKECGEKTAASDPGSELHFMKYMARWRDHIYTAANEIIKRSRPD